MAAARFKLLIPLFFLLQACAQQSWIASMAASGCVADSEKLVSEADWTDPGKLSVRIRQGEFTPMVFALTKNRPYEIEFENADDVSHVFQAPDFFRSVAFDKIVADGKEIKKICPRSLVIEPGKKLMAYLIPVRDGRYEFSDNTFNLPTGPLAGVGGSISIEKKRGFLIRPPKSIPPYPEGIREFLNAPVRPPVEPGPGPQPGGLFDDTEQSPPAEPGGLFDDQEQNPPAEPGGPAESPASAPPIEEMFADPLKEDSQKEAPQQPIFPPPPAPVETSPEPPTVQEEPAPAKDIIEREPPAVPAPVPEPKPEAKKALAPDPDYDPTLPPLEELLKDEPGDIPLFSDDAGSDAPLPSLKELLGAEPKAPIPARKKGKGTDGHKASRAKPVVPKDSLPKASVAPEVKTPEVSPKEPEKKAVPVEKEKTQKEQQPDLFGDDLFKLPDDNTEGGGAGADDTLLEDSLRYLPYFGLGGMNGG